MSRPLSWPRTTKERSWWAITGGNEAAGPGAAFAGAGAAGTAAANVSCRALAWLNTGPWAGCSHSHGVSMCPRFSRRLRRDRHTLMAIQIHAAKTSSGASLMSSSTTAHTTTTPTVISTPSTAISPFILASLPWSDSDPSIGSFEHNRRQDKQSCPQS